MNRKSFLSTTALAGCALPLELLAAPAAEAAVVVPGFLQPGDVVGITAPAGYTTFREVEPAVRQLSSWGFQVRLGNTIGKRDATFGGTDAERVADFQQLLHDRAVKAILCARGGYGLVRIIDQIDFSRFRRYPKWIIGFSDVTVLHAHINRNFGVATIHSKMCNSFPEDLDKAEAVQVDSIRSIRDALTGKTVRYSAGANTANRQGVAEAVLVGGNLKTLESLAGSSSDIRTAGKILFVEDVGEYLYSIDRMFWNLKRSGKLDHLAGLIVGGFRIKPTENPAEEFGKKLEEIVLEKITDCRYPVCFDFPVGHQKYNVALRCGMKHRLVVSDSGASLSS